ncbi:HXXEE domain-containing protein [Actinomadura formosensis]|uniref:HXXEE domain-containing protein n=1 Tax=Actinomadura formosensis TaxID=60706 RepID=UPI003D8E9A0E
MMRDAGIGLLIAWMVHDAEEVAVGPRWIRARLPELRERFPQAPAGVWRWMESVDEREFAMAVAVMGTLVAGAAADGQRTGGRSAMYQAALTGFGLHGLVHLGQAAALRRYTPGSVTSALVVIPYTVWARAQLRRRGILRPTRPRDVTRGLALAVAGVAGAHLLAHRLTARPGAARTAGDHARIS